MPIATLKTQTLITSASPRIAPHPKGQEMRLIDAGLLHYEASLAGFAERYARGETSHTIHVWWARRPHSAMRALVFASLCREVSPETENALKRIGVAGSQSIELPRVRKMLKSQYKQPPKVLDMFGGGGTISMEALNVGAEAYAIDANQLSIFIQKCNLIYSQDVIDKDIRLLLRKAGNRVLSQFSEESAPLYPLRESNLLGANNKSPFAYLWTYKTACLSCGYQFFLSKRHWLSKKKGKNIAFLFNDRTKSQSVEIGTKDENAKKSSVWFGRNGTIQCPKCSEIRSNISIKDCADEVLAMVRPAGKTGKEFVLVNDEALPDASVISKIEEVALQELNAEIPASVLPRWSGIVNPAIYGIETHGEFLNKRQRASLLLLIKALKNEYEQLERTEGVYTARYIIGVLSSLIDQLVDWNCRLSMWIPQNEQMGRAFCGPGVSMLWDYAEIDPVLNGPANLWSKLDRIIAGASSIGKFQQDCSVQQAYAQSLPFADDYFDAIVTDPPYYDNIYYNVLADFFYAWKRLLLRFIEPELFASSSTDSTRELVASKFRSKTQQQAHEDYCRELSLALCEAERVLKPSGVFSFVYSHSSLNGWEAIVRAFRQTRFRITSVQPLSIERKQRPRAMTSEAINTCITFVSHKQELKKAKAVIDTLTGEVREVAKKLNSQLTAVNWHKEDIALAIFAHGVAMLSNAEKVSGVEDDFEALRCIEKVVKDYIPSFKVQDRNSL